MKKLLPVAFFLAVSIGIPAIAHEAPIRVVVLGEDSDRNVVVNGGVKPDQRAAQK